MANVVNGTDVTFSKYKFHRDIFASVFNNNNFYNQRPITKSMLAWWAFQNPEQKLLPLDVPLEIEHIYARNRRETGRAISPESLELLGNKSLLEKRINIRASDYRFADKVKYYRGYSNSKGEKPGTDIQELVSLSNEISDFTEENIAKRNTEILDGFLGFLDENGLLQ